MPYPLPRYIRNMEETVNPAYINKGSKIGYIFNYPLFALAFFYLSHYLSSRFFPFFFDKGSVRNNYVLFPEIKRNDFKFECRA